MVQMRKKKTKKIAPVSLATTVLFLSQLKHFCLALVIF